MAKDNMLPAIRFAGFNDAWEQRKLGEIATEIIAGGDVNNILIRTKGKYPVIANALTNDGIIGYYDYNYRVKSPAVTVTGRGNIGQAKARTINFTPVVRLLSIKTSHDIFFLENSINILNIIIESTGVPQLTVPQISSYIIYIPEKIEEEKLIGHFFRSLDRLIALHQRKCDSFKKVKKALLEKMFPKNGSFVPEIRFSGFDDAWEQRKLSAIAKIHARIGWQNLRASEFLEKGDYYLITGTDFEDGKINIKNCYFVTKERYEQDNNIKINNGSILITKDGTLGKVAYVEGLNKPATLNTGIFNVVIFDKNIDDKYLFQYLKAPFLMNYVGGMATGGTIKHLNQNILVNFPIVYPSYFEQKKIGHFFRSLDHLITLQQRKIKILRDIKKAFLEKMFV